MRTIVVLLTAASAAGAGCGGTSGECADGTYRFKDRCYAVDPNDTTPPVVSVSPTTRTRFVGDVRLTTDEPATIYYTTDDTVPTVGSPSEPENVVVPDVADDGVIQFFAVDLAGNTSEVVRQTWVVDREGPPAPRPFAVALAGAARSVTWTNPTAGDLAGVMIARVEGPLVAPEAGRTYAVGDVIGPGITVVSVGPATAGTAGTFDESLAAGPGMVRYAAWSYDDLGNYGATAADHELIAIPAQTGKISVNAATGVVSVPMAPANIGLTGTATFDAGTLTVTLSVQNRTTRPLFAPKIVLSNPTGSTGTWSDEDGELATLPYRAYGAALAPGATVARTYVFTGVTAGDVLLADVEFKFGRVFATGFWDDRAGGVMDEEAGEEVSVLGSAGGKARGLGGTQSLRAGGITPEGYFVLGSRTTSRVTTFDLATGTLVGGVTLDDYKSASAQVVLDAGGATGYVLDLYGHGYTARMGGALADLVRFDVIGLKETGRIRLGSARSRSDVRMSPDGRYLAIASGLQKVQIVDLDLFRVVREIDSQAAAVTWAADGTSVTFAGWDGITTYTTGTWAPTRTVALPPTGGKVQRLGFGGDGRLWLGRDDEVQAIDLATTTTTTFNFDGDFLEIYEGKPHVCGSGDSNVRRLDLLGVQEVQWNLSESAYGHAFARSPF